MKGWQKSLIKRLLSKQNLTLKFFDKPIQEVNPVQYKHSDAIAVFVNSKVEKKVIDSVKNLKLITTMSTGYDHIDVDHAEKKDITVTSVPLYGENTVAEHTFGLILSISRKIHTTYKRTNEGNYSIEGLMGFDLRGKTIGIIGGGHIGMHVAKIARGFDMNVLVFDLNKDNFKSELLNFEYTDIDTIYKKSDIITLHVPYNKNTHHLINNNSFSKMKKGVILINTSRGGVVDTNSLIKALDKGKVGGAGIDVIEGENLIHEEKSLIDTSEKDSRFKQLVEDQVLIGMPNVVYTPHIAFYSKDAIERIIRTTSENIINFNTGKVKNKI
ncbi:MAG: NAD(P)-dependent oxidoreductase [Nanobdellota archaeon]